MEQDSKKIIELLAKNEAKLAELYLEYSKNYPQDIWQELVRDERVHFQWINTLKDIPGVVFSSERFSVEAIESMIEHIDKLKQEALNKSLIEAFSIALDLENSLLEKKYFSTFKSDEEELKEVFDNLNRATQEHVAKVKTGLDRAKGELPQNNELYKS